jgi:hypothetical protein
VPYAVSFDDVFYESGLSINVMYTIDEPKKRAVGKTITQPRFQDVVWSTEGRATKEQEMASSAAGEVVGRFYEAFGSGDIDAALAT